MEKVLKVKEIFERKIDKTMAIIKDYNDKCISLEMENRNPRILHSKYLENAAKIKSHERLIDDLKPQLKAYREAVAVINNLITNFEEEKETE